MSNTYDISNLAKVSADGFTAASFPEIKDAYIQAMQAIYGIDIDVSDASADGQYVMMESLVLNNIYRTLESLSDNLSIASASGTYLDVLSQLSGITRRDETYSTVNLIVRNKGTTETTPTYLFFRDASRNDWQWINPINYSGEHAVTFYPGKATAITATAAKLGPIAAPAGTTFETIEYTDLKVEMEEGSSATLGQSRETDSELKTRRFRSLGQSGRTVIDSLQANLLNLSGMEDVWVFANNTDSNKTMLDNQIVSPHDVYVVTYPQHNITVPDSIVGETIYNTLTPGIKTPVIPTVAAGETLQGGSKKELTIKLTGTIEATINWKQALEQVDVFNIYLSLTTAGETDNSLNNTDQQNQIKNAILTYLNNVRLGQQVDLQELAQIIQSVDFRTKKYGNATYTVSGIERIGSSTTEGSSSTFPESYSLPLARYYYSDVSFSKGNKQITVYVKLETPIVTISETGLATWTAVPNATSYRYKVGNNGNTTTETSVQLTAGQAIQVQAINTDTPARYMPSNFSETKTYTGGN